MMRFKWMTILILMGTVSSMVGMAEVFRVPVDAKMEHLGLKVCGEVLIDTSGELKVAFSSDKVKGGRLELVANRILVQTLGRINVSGTMGEPGHQLNPNASSSGGYGGGYGGYGGAPATKDRGPIYGDATSPTIERGSFGGNAAVMFGREPGGMVVIRGETVSIDGIIEANGLKGEDWSSNPLDGPAPQRYFGGGGGSGGGILIIARRLTIGPQAKITANGGDGGRGWLDDSCFYGYPGGGGRIKIFYEEGTISETAIMEVRRGSSPTPVEHCGGHGGATDGTIHIEKVKSVDQLLNPGDLNGDGKTDHEDLFLLYQSWQKEVIPIPTAVPTETE